MSETQNQGTIDLVPYVPLSKRFPFLSLSVCTYKTKESASSSLAEKEAKALGATPPPRLQLPGIWVSICFCLVGFLVWVLAVCGHLYRAEQYNYLHQIPLPRE